MIEGLRLCEEIVGSDYELETLLYSPSLMSSSRARKLITRFQQTNIPLTEVDEKSLKRLTDTVQSQGMVGIVKKMEFDLDKVLSSRPQILVAVDSINDPGNLGTIIRTACWFGASGILVSRNSVEYTNPKVLRASMGSMFYLPVVAKLDLAKALVELKKLGYALYIADSHGSRLYTEAQYGMKNVLILGNEISGVQKELRSMATSLIRISKSGWGESLNVAVAAGIILAEMSRKIYPRK